MFISKVHWTQSLQSGLGPVRSFLGSSRCLDLPVNMLLGSRLLAALRHICTQNPAASSLSVSSLSLPRSLPPSLSLPTPFPYAPHKLPMANNWDPAWCGMWSVDHCVMGEHSVITKTPWVKPLEGSCRDWLWVLDGTDTYLGFADLRVGFWVFFVFCFFLNCTAGS